MNGGLVHELLFHDKQLCRGKLDNVTVNLLQVQVRANQRIFHFPFRFVLKSTLIFSDQFKLKGSNIPILDLKQKIP